MALSENITKEIDKLSLQNNQADIVSYLKPKLVNNEILPQDVYDYAKRFSWAKKPGKPHVIEADTINKLGVIIAGLDDDNTKLLASQFYLLAADRDSAWGCKNYAQCALYGSKGAKKSEKTALKYAEMAIKLSKNTKECHQFKDIYAKALKAHNNLSSAFTAMTDYLCYAVTLKDNDKSVKSAASFCKELIDGFLNDFKEGNFDFGLAEEHSKPPPPSASVHYFLFG